MTSEKQLMMEKEIIVIFGDISNAFDRVWQKGLLYKLKSIGMDDTVLKIKSCGTFASRKASSNVSHPCGLKYFLFRSTSLTKSTTLLPLTVSAASSQPLSRRPFIPSL
jgi:hypothetical protein